ncbi:hypothetical protein EZS27_027041 [termite gut metagenome]|uniref:Uncharacterized protein n=1 Tax=termite gut metagenome TaxID=433724 RepID=A0A5J4QQX5_9ZZZZ
MNGRKTVINIFFCRKIVTFATSSKKTMSIKTKELIKLLEENGWVYQRTQGDHRIYYKKGARRSIPVSGKLNSDMKEGMFRNIVREAGIKETIRQKENENN